MGSSAAVRYGAPINERYRRKRVAMTTAKKARPSFDTIWMPPPTKADSAVRKMNPHKRGATSSPMSSSEGVTSKSCSHARGKCGTNHLERRY